MKDDSLEEKIRLYGKRKQHCAEKGFPYRRKKQAKMESFSLYWGKNKSFRLCREDKYPYPPRVRDILPLSHAFFLTITYLILEECFGVYGVIGSFIVLIVLIMIDGKRIDQSA